MHLPPFRNALSKCVQYDVAHWDYHGTLVELKWPCVSIAIPHDPHHTSSTEKKNIDMFGDDGVTLMWSTMLS